MTEEDTLVKQLAAPIIREHKQSKKFNRRNRAAWNRMNRPEKLDKMEKGAAIIMNFLGRLDNK